MSNATKTERIAGPAHLDEGAMLRTLSSYEERTTADVVRRLIRHAHASLPNYVPGHPTGTLVWVGWCIVRGTTMSDFCAPVHVTVP